MRACYDGSVSVESVGIERSGSFVIYTVIGGVQTLFGPVVGTAIIMYLENVLSAARPAWRLIEGVVFVLVIVFLPAGIVGTLLKRRGTRSRAVLSGALRGGTARPAAATGADDTAAPGAEGR